MTNLNLVTFKIETGIKGLYSEVEVAKGSSEWQELFVVDACKKASRKAITNNAVGHSTDLEDYLLTRAWEQTLKYDAQINPNFEAYIRQYLNFATRDFYSSPTNCISTAKHDVANFSTLATSDDEGSESDFESTYNSGANPLDSDSINCIQVGEFMSTLTSRQLSILTLKTQGYEVNEISAELGVHRNTINNTLKTIKELALDFGLEEL